MKTLRESILSAASVADAYVGVDKVSAAEALTHLISIQYGKTHTRHLIRIYAMVLRETPVPEDVSEMFN